MPNQARSFGIIIFTVIALAGVAYGVWPVRLHVLGSDINCDYAPVAAMRDEPDTTSKTAIDLTRACQQEGKQHILIGGGIAIAALVALFVCLSQPSYRPWWDGQQWRTEPYGSVPPRPMAPPPGPD